LDGTKSMGNNANGDELQLLTGKLNVSTVESFLKTVVIAIYIPIAITTWLSLVTKSILL